MEPVRRTRGVGDCEGLFREKEGEPVIVEGPRNRTVIVGSSVTLPCLVEPSSSGGTAGATSVLWLQDGRSLASQGSSPWRQLDTGALLLHRVDVADAGAYRCNARNAHGVAYSETAQLVVHGEEMTTGKAVKFGAGEKKGGSSSRAAEGGLLQASWGC
ncbi:hypothetical protein MRX96_016079 [Rhipicephalus microplus]